MLRNRIDATFDALRQRAKKGLIAYIGAGDPDLNATAALVRAFEDAGVDVVELGVPFSDPLADGIVNQMAAERALRSGTTLDGVLDMTRQLRKDGCAMPVVLYIYYNLIHRHGVTKFARDAASAGVNGVLTLDLPPEEAGECRTSLIRAGIHPIFLIAPTTPPKRLNAICQQAAGFIYYVSREGVTGARQSVSASIQPMVEQIRRCTRVPVAVGFGISNPEQARTVAGMADAVVVGSAIVNQIARHGAKPDMVKHVTRFVKPLVKAVHDL